MKKVFKYAAVMLLLTGASAANAGAILASSTGATGNVSVTGFADGTPSTIDILLTYTNNPNIDVTSQLYVGQQYNFNSTFNIIGFNNANPKFTVTAQTSVGIGSTGLNPFFSSIFPASGSPLGQFQLGSSLLNLLSVTSGVSGGNATLLLSTQVVSGNISNNLTNIAIFQGHAGTANATFDNGTITVTPEPATFLLMGAGLVGLAAAKKRKAA